MSARSATVSAQACSYSTSGIDILHHVTFGLYPGELCALIGPSGAGKSTLMKLALGFLTPTDGAISRRNEDAPMGYVPQDDALHRVLRVKDCLHYSAALRLPHLSTDERDARVEEVTRKVGLTERANVRIKRLSGGQRKRVSVAIELLTTPPMLILDEPTSGLDPGLEKRMMELFLGLAHGGRSVLVATHAMQSLKICSAVLILMKGRVVFFGKPADALTYFKTERFGAIFDILEKDAPRIWQQRFAKTELRTAFAKRDPPKIEVSSTKAVRPTGAAKDDQQSVTPQSAPTVSEAAPSPSPPPTDVAPVPPSADDELAKLKAKMGLPS